MDSYVSIETASQAYHRIIPDLNITVTWHDETRTIMVYTLYPGWTVDDVFAAIDCDVTMSARTTHRIDYIADFSRTQRLPSGLMQTVDYLNKNRYHNGGIVVIVIPPGFVRTFLAVLTALTGASDEYFYCGTFEEALTIIAGQRGTAAV